MICSCLYNYISTELTYRVMNKVMCQFSRIVCSPGLVCVCTRQTLSWMFHDCLVPWPIFITFIWGTERCYHLDQRLASFPLFPLPPFISHFHTCIFLSALNSCCVHLFALRGALQYAESSRRRPNILLESFFLPWPPDPQCLCEAQQPVPKYAGRRFRPHLTPAHTSLVWKLRPGSINTLSLDSE